MQALVADNGDVILARSPQFDTAIASMESFSFDYYHCRREKIMPNVWEQNGALMLVIHLLKLRRLSNVKSPDKKSNQTSFSR
jgi:hypothetical protein